MSFLQTVQNRIISINNNVYVNCIQYADMVNKIIAYCYGSIF